MEGSLVVGVGGDSLSEPNNKNQGDSSSVSPGLVVRT